jgi:UDP-N-acetylglucosamine transferase subunit ALG13
MIFITVGTSDLPFDRLLRGIDHFSGGETVVVQHGPSEVRPAHATCVDFMVFEDLIETIRKARVVITHAGVGSVMATLSAGKRPIVVPRRRCFGEAVDDHQLELGRKLQTSALATLIEDPDDLRRALGPQKVVNPPLREETTLAAELRAYLLSCSRARSIGHNDA